MMSADSHHGTVAADVDGSHVAVARSWLSRLRHAYVLQDNAAWLQVGALEEVNVIKFVMYAHIVRHVHSSVLTMHCSSRTW